MVDSSEIERRVGAYYTRPRRGARRDRSRRGLELRGVPAAALRAAAAGRRRPAPASRSSTTAAATAGCSTYLDGAGRTGPLPRLRRRAGDDRERARTPRRAADAHVRLRRGRAAGRPTSWSRAGSSTCCWRPRRRAWPEYVRETIDRLAALSTRGFAFNMLTSYSDADRMRPDCTTPTRGRCSTLQAASFAPRGAPARLRALRVHESSSTTRRLDQRGRPQDRHLRHR